MTDARRAFRPVLLAALAAACGGEEQAPDACPAPACPVDTAGLDLSTPAVGFTAEVLPLLRRSCGLSNSCHGSATSSAADLYLGPKRSDTTTVIDQALRQKIIDAIVDVPSKTAAAMALVKPSDPTQSFLMLKMDGCHVAAGLVCTPQPKSKSGAACGDRMPQTASPLCVEDRDVMRRWIAQGASND